MQINRKIEAVTSKEGDVEVKAGGVERQIVGVAVRGFEVASGVEVVEIPKATSEVGEERQLRP